MEAAELEILRYPIGKFSFNANADEKEIAKKISEIEKLPSEISNAVKGLNDSQLDTTYRDGGWTVRQVVHHVADSHMNAFMRVKLALTENNPTIKPYDENSWAKLEDMKLPVEVSLSIIAPVHVRFVHLLKKISHSDLSKTIFHPESKREMSIKFLIALYSWHGKHHTAHITELRKRMKW